MALVQLRALCIESSNLKNNYTLQAYLTVHGFTDKAKEVDQFFAQNIGGPITLREAIKVTADKFIAHYDAVIKSNSDEGDYDVKSTFYRFICEKELSRSNSGIV